MREFLVLLKKELKSITREKTIMFAVMIQFCVAALSSVLLVGIMAFYDPSSIGENARANIRIGLVSSGYGPMNEFLMQKHIRFKPYSDSQTAEEAFQAGKLDAVMVIPNEESGVVDMKLVLPELDAKKTVVMMMLQEPLKKYENYLRFQNGVRINYGDLGGKPSNNFEFLYSIIIPVLMLFPALIAGSIMIDTVAEEFENRTFDALMASPVSLGQVFSAKIAAAVVTSILQVVLWSVLLRFNGLSVRNLPLVLFIAVMVSALISFIAAVIALYFKDRERSQFVYSIVLIVLVGASYLSGLSPITLITRLASGVPHIDAVNIGIYALLLLAAVFIFFKLSRRLVFSKH